MRWRNVSPEPHVDVQSVQLDHFDQPPFTEHDTRLRHDCRAIAAQNSCLNITKKIYMTNAAIPFEAGAAMVTHWGKHSAGSSVFRCSDPDSQVRRTLGADCCSSGSDSTHRRRSSHCTCSRTTNHPSHPPLKHSIGSR